MTEDTTQEETKLGQLTLYDEYKEKIRSMTYKNRLDFYECPFPEDSLASMIHFIYQRDEDGLKAYKKQYNKIVNKLKTKPRLECIFSDHPFEYKFKFEGIDRLF